MFKDFNLQDLAWIIVKSRPGLLYASLSISQPSALHAITTSNWNKTVADQFPRVAEIAKEVA
jgi:hypothetical protein